MAERERPGERRAAVRTGVVWTALRQVLDASEPLEVLDIGGGTGGFAVGVAELGHRVRVVDPSPDALAALDRRARERGVEDRIEAQQGDLSSLGDLVDPGSVDVVLCHGVLEVVDDPSIALAGIAGVLRPGGALSLLVAQRHAAVLSRAMAGQFQQARALLGPTREPEEAGARGAARRFSAAEIDGLLAGAGFMVASTHGIRVFADLVPGSLVDAEPGAVEALVELEQAVADRPEFFPLAAQLHLVARR